MTRTVLVTYHLNPEVAATLRGDCPQTHVVNATTALVLIKLAHTIAWAFFAGCILLLPVAAFYGRF